MQSRSANGLSVVLASLLLIAPSSARAQDASTSPAPSPQTILHVVLKDFGALVSARTGTIIGIGGGAALAVLPADRHINVQVAGSDYRFLNSGRMLGSALVQVGTAAGTYLVGYGLGGQQSTTARVGAELLRAQIVSGAITAGLKQAVRRQRPDGSDRRSFPSGHASATFAAATVLTSHFGLRAAVPGFLIATYVGSSRLHENRHNASDVLFGAAIGIAVGQSVRDRRVAGVNLELLTFPGGAGASIKW